MERSHQILRVATYNIHKCRGLDGLVRPDRILDVLQPMNADVIALQEVLTLDSVDRARDHLRFIADGLGFHFAFGETRLLKGSRYGNAVLSRFPIHAHHHYDISKRGRETRGCLRTDIRIFGSTLHLFNVHFGTRFFEHRQQARRLFEEEIVCHGELKGPRIVLGDFNEWVRGAVTRTLKLHLEHADIRQHLKRTTSYPGMLPIFHLDNIYFDRALTLKHLHLHRARPAMIASDHLPLVADFGWQFVDLLLTDESEGATARRCLIARPGSG